LTQPRGKRQGRETIGRKNGGCVNARIRQHDPLAEFFGVASKTEKPTSLLAFPFQKGRRSGLNFIRWPVERALAHQDPDPVRRAYARGTFWTERVEMAQWWADYLDKVKLPPS
jgi:hypothetical protein